VGSARGMSGSPVRCVSGRLAAGEVGEAGEAGEAGRRGWAWWRRLAGGPARATAILLLATVLGLDNADLGSIGSTASTLERSLSLSNGELGLLAAIPSLCAALLTLPFGALTDRTRRVRVLWVAMLVWGAAQLASAGAGSFGQLLLIRVVLGAASGAAAPLVASLIGDLFPAAERGRIWGLVLSGELLGSAFGYVVAGEAASIGAGASGWRIAFVVLGVPSLLAAGAVWRYLPEPARGGASCLPVGAPRFIPAEAVLSEPPLRLGLGQAAAAVLRVRTNVVLIIASALGYFYFTGVLTFGLVLFQGRYRLAHGVATLLLALLGAGGLVGVVASGRLADRWMRRGHPSARIVIGASALVLAAVLFGPGLIAPSVATALPLFILAAVAMGARNPPLDAARLDIMPHDLWGRAEGVRTFLRQMVTATAPLLFGILADAFGAPGAGVAANSSQGAGAAADAHGLQLTFLILLLTPALGGALTFLATRSYPRDAAAAQAAEQARPGPGRREKHGAAPAAPPSPAG
jgi:MFS family permease